MREQMMPPEHPQEAWAVPVPLLACVGSPGTDEETDAWEVGTSAGEGVGVSGQPALGPVKRDSGLARAPCSIWLAFSGDP